MKRKTGVLIAVLTLVSTAGYLTFAKISKTRGLGFTAAASRPLTQGSLQIVDPEGGVVETMRGELSAYSRGLKGSVRAQQSEERS